MIREILQVPNKALRTKCDLVESIDDSTKDLVNDMFETMYKNNGIGLSANQVGVLQRIAVIDIDQEPNLKLVLINPEIYFWSEDSDIVSEEGCLSVPKIWGTVKRNGHIKVKYQDLNGKECNLDAKGLLAIVIQHEIDHLDGKVFIDQLSRIRRGIAQRRINKLSKREYIIEK